MCECVLEKVKALLTAPTVCAGLKAAAQAYLDAVNTPAQADAAKALIAELEADINTIDETIEFLGSERAAQYMGAEKAAAMLKDTVELKAKGEKYCPCPGCVAGLAVLAVKEKL